MGALLSTLRVRDTSVTVDLLIAVGQSNAAGKGDYLLSPACPTGIYIDNGAISVPLADPVDQANTGSMWPAFANEWYANAGRRLAVTVKAVGGTALLPDTAGSNWSPSGTLRAAAVSRANLAISAIAASPDYSLGRVFFVWVQGEADAIVPTAGPDYEQALEELATYFKAQVPQMETMGVVRLGISTAGGTDASDWAAIRDGQEEACTDSALLTMLYRGTYSFVARGLMFDDTHYGQTGLNLAGKCAARALATSTAAIPSAPVYAAADVVADPNTTPATSLTDSHTTAANTDFMIVAVGAQKTSASGVMICASCTFNGVAMTLLAEANVAKTATCRSIAAIYYLDEATYGASLANVTANIVFTPSTSANCINMVTVDCVGDGLAEFSAISELSDVTAATSTITTSGPTLVIACSAGASAGASAPTATWNNGTELMDNGASSGTRTGQFSAVRDSLATAYTDRAYTATWSVICDSAASVTAAFRGRIAGE